ncbi:hypothetical protein, partial [Sphingopyxis soli]|uniref:hypothetical protein n=1 Tax=Sphingopyxis soli TaxID=592051 RepID=UPI001BFD71A2
MAAPAIKRENEWVGRRLAQPDNVGKGYLKAHPFWGGERPFNSRHAGCGDGLAVSASMAGP